MITKEQAKCIENLAVAYAVAMVDKWNTPDATSQENFKMRKEEFTGYIDSLTEQPPEYYIVQVGPFFLYDGYDSEGGYLGDELGKARQFNSEASAEFAIHEMPHKENRIAAKVVKRSDVQQSNEK